MKKFLVLLVAMVMMFSLVGCKKEADDLKYIEKNGKLVIGITIYSPMNYYDENGDLTGFDTEFAEAVCAKLGVKPEFIEINWDTKEVELEAKNIDCIWNGLTVTEERKENMDFSASYLNNKQVVVIRKEDAEKYTDVASLAEAAFVAEISSAGETAIKDNETLANAPYTAMNKQTDALLEVNAKTADAAVLDYTLAMSMVGEGTDYADLMVIDGLELINEEYAIGFRLGSSITAKVNDIIAELIEDGTLEAIAEKYGLAGQLVK
ncbi:MAG: transporter substrate-binding domain-containing protein [Christensenellaceae bacterium]|nr:transporter substrate-binding domain-containing protein [Christensenellaceae bacterium]